MGVSARALNVASFNSLSGFDHQDGTKPQRIGTSWRFPSDPTIVSMVVVGPDVVMRPRIARRLIQRESVQRDNFFPRQLVGGPPAHDRQHIALLDECATLRPNSGMPKWDHARRSVNYIE